MYLSKITDTSGKCVALTDQCKREFRIGKYLAKNSLYFAIIALFFSCSPAFAQSTTITTPYTSNTSTSTNSFVTFVIENNSGSGILLTDVGNYCGTNYNGVTATLWYSATSLSGPVTLATPNWNTIASATLSGITTAQINPIITGMSFLIPAGATYRFALHVNSVSINYSSASTPNNFTANGVNLYTGNYQMTNPGQTGSQNVGYVLTLTPRYFRGFVTFIPAGPPCTAPIALNATNITSTAATMSWAAVPGSQGYDYALTTTSAIPTTGITATNSTSFNEAGLTPSTTYYLHVRNKCAPPNQASSAWVTYQFETNPPCTSRQIQKENITADGATIRWKGETHAAQYEYTFKLNRTIPTSATSTTDTAFTADQLAEGTRYYVFVRMLCPGGEVSDWAIDSFTTRTVCRPPALKVDHIEASRAIIYWEPMPTATEYEYEVSQSPTPIGEGTAIQKTNFYAFPLKDGEVYYFHVRSRCDDQDFVSKSDWATTSFQTFPTSVSNIGANSFAVSVHPNPLKDVFTFTINGQITAGAKIMITDLNGKTVHAVEITQKATTVNLNQLPSGVYMLKYADAHNSETIKLIKN